MHRLGIIVPYRDRVDHLHLFKKSIAKFLDATDIQYEIIIVEQDDAKTFNRGKLLNIGFIYAKKLKCDYVVFHDVDMLPINADYSYSDIPIHLACNFSPTNGFTRTIFDEYFGGVTIFPSNIFEDINGYSNEYWGWGYEDNDILYRCRLNNVALDKKEIKMMSGNTAALSFNGKDSYVQCKNDINLINPTTFFISFYPDDIICNPDNYDDTFAVFSIPGLDFTITFNSYSKYNFEMYDANENIIYINSTIKPNYKTNIIITLDPREKIVTMYQDGELVGSKEYEERLYPYRKEQYYYLGAGNPNRTDTPKFFKGTINSFAIFNGILDFNEIREIANNKYYGLTQPFGQYHSEDKLKVYYDAKIIKKYELYDLSGNLNNGKIVNCDIVDYTFEDSKLIDIPFRRDCTFKLIPHEENGYVDNGWKSITTRYNQLKFYNELSTGYRNTKLDGLSNCQFKLHSHTNINNQTHLVVSI